MTGEIATMWQKRHALLCNRNDLVCERRDLLVGAGAVIALGCVLAAAATRADAAANAASARIDDLIARMTIEEKAGQLSCFNDDVRPVGAVFNPVVNPRGADAMLEEVRGGRVGMLFNGYGVAGARRAQDVALRSRLGIPLVFAADVIHGCRTIFPIPLAEAAAFDPDLSERAARAVAREASAAGLHWTFAPVVDVARDERWGRVAEGAGEDVLLNRLLATARVRGFQGSDLRRPESLLATAKHFAGYGAVTGGMEYGAVDISEEMLREVFLPPFASAFAAGAGATIASFTTFNGVPVTANRWLLTRVLREEMGFAGVCVSDYDADRELIAHGVAADEADAARLAILAGIDVSMQSGLYNRHLPALVRDGRVPIATVDRSVRRVLALKEALGLFDDPYRSLDPRAERRAARRAPTTRIAREVATRSIVLLRNDGGLLPLPRTGRRVALIGPFGADRANLNGSWSFAGQAADGIDLATGIRGLLADPRLLTVEPGSGILAALPGAIERAVAAARASDVVLLAIGEGGDMSGEGNSRTEITVPPAQQALAEAVGATGKPVVVLLRHGRALALEGAVRDAPALLATWFLGEQTGPAVADVLFGVVEPTGRLPVSFPFSTGQQPWSYDRAPTGRPAPHDDPTQPGRARWRDAPDAALYPFGAGMGYTCFELRDLVMPTRVDRQRPLTIEAHVANIGSRPGTAFVRVDLRPIVAARSPVRRMAAFARATVPAGGTSVVPLTITSDLLADALEMTVSVDGAVRTHVLHLS
jgi:beta-glucosidase